jgi:hypothetical protein
MLTNIKNSVLSAFTLCLLSLTISSPSYGIAINLTTFTGIGDTSLDSATQATIKSGTLSTVFSGGGSSSLEEFLGIDPNNFATVIPNNVFGSAIKRTLSVNAGDVLSFGYSFSGPDSALDVAFVTLGSTIIPLTSGSAFSSTFTTAGPINFGVGVVDVNDSIGESTLIVQNAELTPVPYEFEMASGAVAFGVWLSRKKVMAKIKSWHSKG